MNKKILFLLLLTLTSCTAINPYIQFYESASTIPSGYLSPSDNVEVIKTDKVTESYFQLLSKGYELIGTSSFNGADRSDQLAIDYAKSLGAEILLLGEAYTDSQIYSYSLPINAYASIPMTNQVRRFDQYAGYFVTRVTKLKTGIYFDNLSTEEKQNYQTNTGVKILAVIDDSPAFKANIIPGDIVTKINDSALYNVESTMEIMGNLKDEDELIFTIIRKGVTQKIKISY